MFKTGDDTVSRARDLESFFGALDTAAKRNGLKESLVAYKQAVEIDSEAKFWVKKIADTSDHLFHYAPNLKRLNIINTEIELAEYNGSRGWYVTSMEFSEMSEAAGKLQLPEAENARYRIKLETSNVEQSLKLPRGLQNTADFFEPVTRDYPDLGPGLAPQLLLENKSSVIVEVYDTLQQRTLSTEEIIELITN